jgi:regulator of cell morphogenesis and NO signaling
MSITNMPLREIATEYPAALSIFERFEIDLCAWGDKPLGEACASLRLSTDQVREKLDALVVAEGGEGEAASLSLTQLIQRIVRVHHRRVRQDLPALARMAERLANRHTSQREAHASVAHSIQTLHSDLLSHIEKEEQVLFPFIAAMEEHTSAYYPAGRACFLSVRQPIATMMQEHLAANRALDALREHTCHFNPSAGACSTQRALYGGLRNFEEDLREHIHLENDILFPRTIGAELELRNRRQP